METLRWKQRFENLTRAKEKLNLALTELNKTPNNELIQMALIQAFEFTYELSWKTLKDYLKHEGVTDVTTPRQVIKQAFHYKIIESGDAWIEMLEDRNILAHTYSEEYAQKAIQAISQKYSGLIDQAYDFFEGKS